MEDKPVVSIILLACNKARFTTRCLEALLQSDYPEVELWLIDNGSTDQTPELFSQVEEALLGRPGWTVRRLDFEKNIGAIQGRNAALKEMTGRYVIFIDNDVVVASTDWLDKMVARMEADHAIGIMGAKLVFPKPENILQCAGCVVTRNGRVDFYGRGKPADDPEYNHEREVQCLISALWIMKREVVDRIGLLDMAYHPVQFEDIDYCYRCREAGWRLLYFPGVTAYHYENVTTDGTESLNYRYLTVKNGLAFKKKWRHMFSKEDGPPEDTIVWQEIPRVAWEEVGSAGKLVGGQAREKLFSLKKIKEAILGQPEEEGESQMQPSDESKGGYPQPEKEAGLEEEGGTQFSEDTEHYDEEQPEETPSPMSPEEEEMLPGDRLSTGLRFGFIALMLLIVLLLICYRDAIRKGSWGEVAQEVSSTFQPSGKGGLEATAGGEGAGEGLVFVPSAKPGEDESSAGSELTTAQLDDTGLDAEAEAARIAAATMQPNATPWTSRAITGYIPEANIVIYAKSKVLQVRSYDQTVRLYRDITLPQMPLTGKTILGTYKTVSPPQDTTHTLFHPDSLCLNYPNAEDAAAAIKAGRITQEEYEKIVKAAEAGGLPYYNTAINGPVFITLTRPNNSSFYSILVKDNLSIQELLKGVPSGTPVWILDR